jgi:hypothetical protein
VFGVEVFMASIFVWVVGCSIKYVVTVWRFVDGCRWSVCGMRAVWVVVSVVVGTCSLAAWDEPLAGSSFPSLFLGVILWVFFRAHTRWVPILGLESHGAIEHQ